MSPHTSIELPESRRDERIPAGLGVRASSLRSATPISSQPTLAETPRIGNTPLTQEEIDQKPWKYIGYRGYSAFLASDSDFCNFRRFDRLNNRVILALQDQLSQLEEELDEIDAQCTGREAPDVNNGTFRYDTQQDRVDLVWEIRQKLEEYNHFILQHMQIKARASANKRDIESLRNWLDNNDGAIMPEERKYIDKDDLFALIPKERSPLRRLFERSSHFRLSKVWRKTSPSTDLPLHVQQHIHLSSDKRIDQFVACTIITVGLVMLIAPIWILAFAYQAVVKLTIITLFILLFLVLLSFGMNAKPYEALAATAAYSAILMVFLQLGNQASTP